MKPKLLCHCSFVPTRLLEALGFETVNLADAPSGSGAGKAGSLFSPQLCGCMQTFARLDLNQVDGVILCNCCASAERLYDRLRHRYPELFVFLLETLCTMDTSSLGWIKSRLEQMLVTLHNRFQLSFPTRLEEAVAWMQKVSCDWEDADASTTKDGVVWLLGSGIHPAWIPPLREIFHGMRLKVSDCLARRRGEELLEALAQGKGEIEPCPRIIDFAPWLEETLLHHRAQIRGVIGMAAQKCDFGLFALPAIRQACERAGIPVLLMEEEFTSETLERSRIRYEAFYESLMSAETCTREPTP